MQSASDLAADLARDAESVCRKYLSNGRRQGRYWLVGDLANNPGRSLYVRLHGPARGRGPAGKWRDAATGEHGDLLDLIRETCGLVDFVDVAEEARRFLSAPRPVATDHRKTLASTDTGSAAAARRLFKMSRPIRGTLVEAYLAGRGITDLAETSALRFHPTCYYRPDCHSPTETWPALIAAVTDAAGAITGAHRTWLDPDGFSDRRLGKAPIDTPRRAMGRLVGHGVWFGAPTDILAVGEGIETVLSVRQAFPALPCIAALSAGHLSALDLPPGLRRLYILRDADPAGDAALEKLLDRAAAADFDALPLTPRREDFNEDLMAFGLERLRAELRGQLSADDVRRLVPCIPSHSATG